MLAVGTGTKSTSGMNWFEIFVVDLETAAQKALPEIEAKAKEFGDKILEIGDKAVGAMAQIAVTSVLKQVGLNIPGESKLAGAITHYLEEVEIQLGFLPSQADATAAVQAAHHKVASKVAALNLS